jgi:hypothetical protein
VADLPAEITLKRTKEKLCARIVRRNIMFEECREALRDIVEMIIKMNIGNEEVETEDEYWNLLMSTAYDIEEEVPF